MADGSTRGMRNEGRDSQGMPHLQMLTRRLLETLMDQSDGILDGSWHVGQDDMSDEGKELFFILQPIFWIVVPLLHLLLGRAAGSASEARGPKHSARFPKVSTVSPGSDEFSTEGVCGKRILTTPAVSRDSTMALVRQYFCTFAESLEPTYLTTLPMVKNDDV